MRKTLFCLAVFCLLTISLADDCKNPLLASLDITGLALPTSGTGLKFCKSLQNAQTCCSSDTVIRFQDKVTALTDKLKATVITRDKTITEARDQVLPAFVASIKSLQDSVTKMANDPKYAAAGASVSGITASFDSVAKDIYTGSAGLKKGFGDYQKSRTSCVVEIVKLQSAAYCLACDPTWASKGVSANGGLTLSDKVCKRLGSACYPFMAAAVAQSELLKVKAMVSVFNGLSSAITKIADGDLAGGVTAMTAAMTAASSATGASSTIDSISPVQLPSGCTSAAQCNWLCSNLFPKGKLDETSLIAGGVVDTSPAIAGLGSSSGGRLLEEEEEEVSVVKNKLAKNRKLATNEWNPESDEAGVTVTFQNDPAGVKPADDAYGSRIGSGFVCMIALLVAYLF